MPKLKNSNEDFSFFDGVNEDSDQYVDRSIEISERILSLIAQRETSQKELAKKLNKSQSEISKWLSGVHNFTVKTIAKLEVALGEPIILPVGGTDYNKTCMNASKGIWITSDPSIYDNKVFLNYGTHIIANECPMMKATPIHLVKTKGRNHKDSSYEIYFETTK